MTEKETIIVVHGTFSGRADGTRRIDIDGESQMWFEPDKRSSFCDKLDAVIQAKKANAGSNITNANGNTETQTQAPPKCWGHLGKNTNHFFWDGANHWLSRYRAATRLRTHLRQLIKSGYTVHLVGHSHGGNVILDAITDNHANVHEWFNGQVALLGTPIYQNKEQSFKKRMLSVSSTAILTLMIWVTLFIVLGVNIDIFSAFVGNSTIQNVALLIALFTIIITIIALVKTVNPFLNQLRGLGDKYPMKRTPQIMLVNSEADEAYRILCDLDKAKNPLTQDQLESGSSDQKSGQTQTGQLSQAIKFLFSNTTESFSFLGPSIKKKLGIVDEKQTIFITFACLLAFAGWILINIYPQWLGLTDAYQSLLNLGIACVFVIIFVWNLKLMISVLLMPGLLLLGFIKSVFSTLKAAVFFIFDYWIKSKVWSYLLEFALGTNGGPRSVNNIDVSRKFTTGAGQNMNVFYFELPEHDVTRIKAKQKQYWSTLYTDVFDKTVVWTPLMLKKALMQQSSDNDTDKAAGDIPMIHTHYYHNPECIDLIAQWFLEPRLIEQNFSRQVDVSPGAPGVGLGGSINQPNKYELHVDRMRIRYKSNYKNWINSTFDSAWEHIHQQKVLEDLNEIEPLIPERYRQLPTKEEMELADRRLPKSPRNMISPSLRKYGPPPNKPGT